MKCIKEMDTKGYLLVPLKARLLSVDLKQRKIHFELPSAPPGWGKKGEKAVKVAALCPKSKKLAEALKDLLKNAEAKPVEGTLLTWPTSDEEARWRPLEGCWLHCFEPGHDLRPPEELRLRLIGEALPSDRKRLALRLANGAILHVLPPARKAAEKVGAGQVVEVVLDGPRLYKEGVLRATRIRAVRGKPKLEFLRLRSLAERPKPALRVEGDEQFSINYSDVVLVHGKPKAGKTRALLALFADGEPTEEGLRVHRKLRPVGRPAVYYLSHLTETPLPRLRKYAEGMGWTPERAEEYLYPFEDPEDLEEFLKDPTVPENSFIIVDSLVKLLPRGVTGESENDALQVEKTLAPLIQAARRRGHLLILVHHQGKRSDDPRGSSAIQALPDHLIWVKEIKSGRGSSRVMEYQKGRATSPRTALLVIREEATEAKRPSDEAARPPARRRYGAPPKYEKPLWKALEELERRGEFEEKLDENGTRRPFFEERAVLKELKRLTSADEKNLRDALERYAGEGRNPRKSPVLKRVEEDGRVYYAALGGTALPSKARSSDSSFKGKKSSRRARVKAT